jgi:TPR repeat protein
MARVSLQDLLNHSDDPVSLRENFINCLKEDGVNHSEVQILNGKDHHVYINLLGDIYHYGYGGIIDIELATKYYLKSLENSHSLNSLGEIAYTHKDYPKAVKYYQESKENPDALYNLGFMYRYGYGVEKDLKKAVELFICCGELGNKDVTYALADIYELNADKDCFKWMEKCAELGNDDMQSALGDIYIKEGKYDLALIYYKQSDKSNNEHACKMLGDIYYQGIGVKIDIKKALKYYEKVPEELNKDILMELGDLYYDESSKSKSNKAKKWYLLAAEHKNPKAYKRLGDIASISVRFGMTNEATGHYMCAAKLGNAESQYIIAEYYRKSYQYKQSFKWYKKSAEQGIVNAQYRLGSMIYTGAYREYDIKKGVQWLEQACENGSSEAAMQLADIYMEDDEDQDKFKALKYICKSRSSERRTELIYEKVASDTDLLLELLNCRDKYYISRYLEEAVRKLLYVRDLQNIIMDYIV